MDISTDHSLNGTRIGNDTVFGHNNESRTGYVVVDDDGMDEDDTESLVSDVEVAVKRSGIDEEDSKAEESSTRRAVISPGDNVFLVVASMVYLAI